MSENVTVVVESTKTERADVARVVLQQAGVKKTIEVPKDEDYKLCLKEIAAMRSEMAAQVQKDRTNADVLLEATAKPIADALGAAIDDCEQLIATLRSTQDGQDSQLVHLSELDGAQYEEWRAQQAAAGTPIDPKTAPIYVTRMRRPLDPATRAVMPWGAPQSFNLRANEMHRRFGAAAMLIFENLRMYKTAHRVLWLERAFETPTALMMLGYYIIYAIEDDYRAEMQAAMSRDNAPADAPAPPPSEEPVRAARVTDVPRDVVLLIADAKCEVYFTTDKAETTEEERAKTKALNENRFNLGSQFFYRTRTEKRNERLCAMIPGLVCAATGAFAQQLAPLYDETGVKVPDEAVIIELTYRDGVFLLDRSVLLRHTQLRAIIKDNLAEIKRLKELHTQAVAAKSKDTEEYSLLLNKRLAEQDGLHGIDQLALASNPRNQIVVSIVDVATGIDSGKDLNASLLHTIKPYALIKRTQHLVEKQKAAIAAYTTPPVDPAPPGQTTEPASKTPEQTESSKPTA